MPPRSFRRWLFLLLTGALAVRLAALFWWQHRLPAGVSFGFPDSESYWALARAIGRFQPYVFGPDDARIFRMPGYPLLLSWLFAIFPQPPVWAGRLVGAVFGTASVGLTAMLARRLFNERAALLAAAVAAVYPGAVLMSVLILSEAPFTFFLLLQLVLWQRALDENTESPLRRRIALAIALGAVAGAATLIRPEWLLFTPFALLIGVVPNRHNLQRFIGLSSIALLTLLCVMTPWWIRNARITGRFVPTTLQVGASLYDALGPQADGSSDMRFVDEMRSAQIAEDAQTAAPLPSTFEYRLDRRMARAATARAFNDPWRTVRLAGEKIRRTWNPWPNESSLRSWPVRLAVAGTCIPVVLGGFLGALIFRKRGFCIILCWFPAFYFALLHAVFVGSIRYRQPAMLPLIVLAAGWAATMVRRRREK